MRSRSVSTSVYDRYDSFAFAIQRSTSSLHTQSLLSCLSIELLEYNIHTWAYPPVLLFSCIAHIW